MMKASIVQSARVPPNNTDEILPSIRIVIADSSGIVRYGLRGLLDQQSDFEIVGEAADGHEALDQAKTLQPDVLLLDQGMPCLDGVSVLKALRKSNQNTRVIMFTDSGDRNQFVEIMRLGCSGILSKQTASPMIVKSIRKVNGGEIWLDSGTTAEVMVQFASRDESAIGEPSRSQGQPSLSKRERQIVQLVSQGLKNKEMADKLLISEQTVKNHMHSIFEKLAVSDRLELALYSISKGWHLD